MFQSSPCFLAAMFGKGKGLTVTFVPMVCAIPIVPSSEGHCSDYPHEVLKIEPVYLRFCERLRINPIANQPFGDHLT
jgi:hypothetical protein